MTVRTATPSTAWAELIEGSAPVTSSGTGAVSLKIPALTALLYRAESTIRPAAPGAVALRVTADDLTALRKASVQVAGGAPASVAVAVRRDRGKAWLRLGVDASAPYRVFLDPRRYRRGETLHLVAVARSLDGQVRQSPVVTVTLPKARG